MKEIIQKIMSDLSVLTRPFNPVKLKHIFEKHPPLEVAQAPSQLITHVEQLIVLRALIEKSFIIGMKKHNLSSQQAHVTELKKQEEALQQKANEYQKQVQDAVELLNTSFLVLEPLLKENIPDRSQLITDYHSTAFSKTQKLAVSEFNDHISRVSETIDRNWAKISLLQLKNKIGELVIALNKLGIACTTISVMKEFQTIVATTMLAINQLEEINKIGGELISQIEKQMPANDVLNKIEEIAQQLSTTNKKLEKVQFDISINTLAIDIKGSLSEQFDKASDKADLIKQYQDQIPSTMLSYFDVQAWSRWAEDHRKYETTIREKENSFHYLTLLEQKEVLLSHKVILEAQKNALERLQPHIQNNTSVDSELTNLLQQTKGLFHKYHLPFPSTPSSNSSLIDFYLAMLYNLPLVEDKLKQMYLIRQAADELSFTVRKVDDLRNKYQLPADQDVLLVRQSELEEQINSFPQKEVLAEWLNLCKSFLELDAKLELLLQQQHEIETQKGTINVQIDKANLEAPEASLIKSLAEEFSCLQDEIASSIEQIKTLPLPLSLLPSSSEKESNSFTTEMVEEGLLAADKQKDTPYSATPPSPHHTVLVSVQTAPQLDKQEPSMASSVLLPQQDAETVPSTLSPEQAVVLLKNASKLSSVSGECGEQPSNQLDLLTSIEPQGVTTSPDSPLTPTVSLQTTTADLQQSAMCTSSLDKDSSHPSKAKQSNTTLTDTSVALREPSTLITPAPATELEATMQPISMPIESHDGTRQPADKIEIVVCTDLSNPVASQEQQSANLCVPPHELEQQHPATATEVERCCSITEKSSESAITNVETPLALSSSPQESELAHTEDSEIQKLEDYHQQISHLLTNCSVEIQQWYLETSKALGAYLIRHPSSYKPSYLLRDILFELLHSPDLNTIQAYMRLCPHAENDLEKLLAIKPNLPQVDEPFDEENVINDAPEQFKLLYEQYLKLRESHPLEGKLLLQAIQSLRMAKVFKDTPNSSLSIEHVPSLALDPRYEPLKRHRGFLRIWEAIEDLYRWIVGIIVGQAEHEYSKRPCFFKTRTAQLLEEADLMVQKDLPSVCLD